MRTSDETWTSIIEAGDFSMESIAVIDGSEYDAISAPVINRSLFTGSPSVGNATAASLEFSVLTSNEIPASAEIVIKSRITDGTNYSDWAEAGTFYIDTRSNDTDTGLKTFTCYDAMLKANQRYCEDETEDSTVRIGWPKYMTDVVDEIASRIGVELDSRTEIKEGDDYIVTFPDDLTMLQVLEGIGSCHGGNWIITPDNKLRLVPLVGRPGTTYYILDDDGNYIVTDDDYYLVGDGATPSSEHPAGGGSLDVAAVLGKVTTGKTLTITGVTMTRESTYTYSAGDDSGYVLDCGDVPYACQQIVEDLLDDLVGLVYVPFTATTAVYDPCAELGDWVYVGNRVVSVIYTEKATYNTSFRSDISAPSKEETESEYPYLTTLEKANQNTMAYVTKVWEEIELEYTSAITQSATDILATVYGSYSQDISIIDTVNGILTSYVTTAYFTEYIELYDEGIKSYVGTYYATSESVTDLEGNLLENYYSVSDVNSLIDQTETSILQTVSASYALIESTVTATETQYYQSTSSTELIGGEWSTTAPTWVSGTYIWNRTVFYYGEPDSDGNYAVVTYSDPICLNSTSRGIDSIQEYYAISDSSETEPTEWYDIPVQMNEEYPYLWNYEAITYTDGTVEETAKRVIGRYGTDGTGIVSITNYYAVSASATEAPTSWSRTVPSTTETERFLWNYEWIQYSDGTSLSTEARVIGADGLGVSSVETYFATAYDNETAPEDGWSTTAPTTLYEISGETVTYLWLWVKYLVTYTDGTTAYTEPFCMTDSAARSMVEEVVEAQGQLELALKYLVDVEDTDSDLYEYMVTHEVSICSVINASADVIYLTSNRLVVESDYFTLDADGTIRATNVYLSGILETEDGYCKASLTSGGLWFYYNNTAYGMFRSGYWTADTSMRGLSLDAEYEADYIFFGHKASSSATNYTSSYIINYGVDPDGYTEDHIFYGTARFTDAIYPSTNIVFANTYGIQAYNTASSVVSLLYLSASNYCILGDSSYTTKIYGSSTYVNGTTVYIGYDSGNSYIYIGYPAVSGVRIWGATVSVGANTTTDTVTIGTYPTTVKINGGTVTIGYSTSTSYSVSVLPQASFSSAVTLSSTLTVEGVTKLNANTSIAGNLYVESSGSIYVHSTDSSDEVCVSVGNSVGIGRLTVTNAGNLGLYDSTNSAWVIQKEISSGTIYIGTTAYSSSDRSLKHDIQTLDEQYSSMLDLMEPVRFIFNNDPSGKYRCGYIAQEVYSAATEAGLDAYEVGIVTVDGDGIMYLDYNQIVPLLHLKIKQQDTRIAELEERIDQLETALAAV